jgi:hypothetical protein
MNLPESHPNDALLNEYLDGMLPPGESSALESHLERCANCSQRLADLQQVFSRLRDLPELPLSVDLAARVTETLKQQRVGENTPFIEQRRLFLHPRLSQLVTGVEAFAALFLLVLYWQSILHTLFRAVPQTMAAVWQTLSQSILELVHPLLTLFTQVPSLLPQWNSATFPLLETLTLLALFWLAGNGYLIFETRRSRRKR